MKPCYLGSASETTPDLDEATEAVLAALAEETDNTTRRRQAWIEYDKIRQGLIETETSLDDDQTVHAKPQLAAIIHKALIFDRAGLKERYLEELDDATVYARNKVRVFKSHADAQRFYDGLDDPDGYFYDQTLDEISTRLAAERDALLGSLELSPATLVVKLRPEISESNFEFLRDQMEAGDDLEDMINHAYGAILDSGGDPDVVLTRLGVLEAEA